MLTVEAYPVVQRSKESGSIASAINNIIKVAGRYHGDHKAGTLPYVSHTILNRIGKRGTVMVCYPPDNAFEAMKQYVLSALSRTSHRYETGNGVEGNSYTDCMPYFMRCSEVIQGFQLWAQMVYRNAGMPGVWGKMTMFTGSVTMEDNQNTNNGAFTLLTLDMQLRAFSFKLGYAHRIIPAVEYEGLFMSLEEHLADLVVICSGFVQEDTGNTDLIASNQLIRLKYPLTLLYEAVFELITVLESGLSDNAK